MGSRYWNQKKRKKLTISISYHHFGEFFQNDGRPSEYPNVSEWDMEIAFETKDLSTTLYVDFGFTMKGWDKKYVFLELKQNNDYKKCIDLMFKDAEKFEDLRSKSTNGIKGRSKLVVGMFQTKSWENIQDYFESCMEHYEFDLDYEEYIFLQNKDQQWGIMVF